MSNIIFILIRASVSRYGGHLFRLPKRGTDVFLSDHEQVTCALMFFDKGRVRYLYVKEVDSFLEQFFILHNNRLHSKQISTYVATVTVIYLKSQRL